MTRDDDSFTSKLLWFSLRMLINMVLLFVLVEGFITAYHFSYKVFADFPYISTSDVVVNVAVLEGDTPMQVAVTLEQSGVVESRYLFLARVYLGRYGDKIQAGNYTLGPGMTPDEICRKLCGAGSGGAA
ncbi:MAG: hypothetical protein K2K56_09510 [Lachnospiraceae bacterium]|nr:hypothetical protein [Lachnospiraceae bacterium]MDE6626591.1 hypothetical protein [Lachnospiraceae bacterium]